MGQHAGFIGLNPLKDAKAKAPAHRGQASTGASIQDTC